MAADRPEPVGEGEFAGLMAPLGPWPSGRAVAVAVSGGADSLALAWLAARWGRARGFVVDHGLRPDSAAEAAWTAAALAGFGVASRVLRVHGLRHGAGLAARARTARYALLLQACAEAGLADLLLGHHAGDQAETMLMRRLARSGPRGLSAMAAASARAPCRLLRPLLGVAPGRLRATLAAAGRHWVEDPSNRDPAAQRTRLRATLSGDAPAAAALLAEAAVHGRTRAVAETACAAALARLVALRPAGFAVLAPGPWPTDALATVLRVLGGAIYAPDARAVAALAASPRPATLGGVRLLPAGRLGPGWLLVREAAAMAPPVAALAAATWDGRFRLLGPGDPGLTLGALGADAVRGPGTLPAAARCTLPALRRGGRVVAVPHEDAGGEWRDRVLFDPPGPAAGAPFEPAPPPPGGAALP